jgi:hypothetical protein
MKPVKKANHNGSLQSLLPRMWLILPAAWKEAWITPFTKWQANEEK